jgi:hypothetical protein
MATPSIEVTHVLRIWKNCNILPFSKDCPLFSVSPDDSVKVVGYYIHNYDNDSHALTFNIAGRDVYLSNQDIYYILDGIYEPFDIDREGSLYNVLQGNCDE